MSEKQIIQLVKITRWFCRYWLHIFLIAFGVFNLLPFLAPLLAELGWISGAKAIHMLYLPFCHQMAHRSFFLFGDKLMYAPNELPVTLTGDVTDNMLAMKYFIGNDTLGWKVAWSDRMVYMYGAMWLSAFLFFLFLRNKPIQPLPLLLFVGLLIPMGIDGLTHTWSDFTVGGLFDSFRYTNDWLAQLTNNQFNASFYSGDTIGSFNSWMRLISGIGFGLALVGFFFPLFAKDMFQKWSLLDEKLRQYHRQKYLRHHQEG